jgi:hypothetical protein
VPELLLLPHEQTALCSLLAAEPVPGRALPERRVLALLGQLVPCDAIGGLLYGASGDVVDTVDHPPGSLSREGPRHHPRGDALRVELRNGADHAVVLQLSRSRHRFRRA